MVFIGPIQFTNFRLVYLLTKYFRKALNKKCNGMCPNYYIISIWYRIVFWVHMTYCCQLSPSRQDSSPISLGAHCSRIIISYSWQATLIPLKIFKFLKRLLYWLNIVNSKISNPWKIFFFKYQIKLVFIHIINYFNKLKVFFLICNKLSFHIFRSFKHSAFYSQLILKIFCKKIYISKWN